MLLNMLTQSMQAIKIILILIIILNLFSCGKESMLPSDYVEWVNNIDNGLLKEKTISPLNVELLYKPIPYIISNEKRSNKIPKKEYEARVNKLKGLQYYTLKLSIVGGETDVTNFEVSEISQQQDRLSYLSFAMKNDIRLIEEGDTLPCVLYHFERSYDVVPSRTFVLAFDQRPEYKKSNKTLVLDLSYFKTGPIKINFKTSDLERIPNLKL